MRDRATTPIPRARLASGLCHVRVDPVGQRVRIGPRQPRAVSMRVPRTALKAMAAATWYIGGGVLLLKASGYLLGSVAAGAVGAAGPASIAVVAGVGVGVLRGRTLFLRACRRNLRRIDSLDRPRAWQFFRPAFFVALVAMMAAGAGLSWVAGTGPWAAVAVGGLELVIATALLTSGIAFWRPEPVTEREASEGRRPALLNQSDRPGSRPPAGPLSRRRRSC